MSEFKSKRVARKVSQKINASSEKIFPLLSPDKMTEWLDGWNFQMIYSETGGGEEGAIFQTKHEEKISTTWIITKFDEENKIIEFFRITPEILAVQIKMQIEDNKNETSNLELEYIFTALTEKGNEYVEGNSSKKFFDMMKWWEKSLNYYLESGKKLLALKL